MLISVIVPIYNSELWLDDCLTSLLEQNISENDYEIICVNDGSTDSSEKIINRYADIDNRIKRFSKENGGLASALNYGIERAKGRYILLVNSDDYIDANSISEVCSWMDIHEIDIFHGSTAEVPFDARYNHQTHELQYSEINGQYYAAPGDGGYTVYRSTLLKSSKEQILWDSKAGFGAEWLFYDSVSRKAKKIVFVRYPTYYHRMVNTSLGHIRTRESTIKKMESLKYMALKYKNEFNYSVAYRMAVQSYLVSAISVYDNKTLKNKIIPELVELGLYPYKLITRNIKPVITANKLRLKLTLVNYGMLFFPFKPYYLLFSTLFRRYIRLDG